MKPSGRCRKAPGPAPHARPVLKYLTCCHRAEAPRQRVALSRQLVEADAKAREELVVLQHDLRADQAEIGHQRDQLAAERRQIAEQRYPDPLIATAILHVGLVLACLLPLAFGVYVLWSLRRSGDSDGALVELLIEEMVADRPPIGL